MSADANKALVKRWFEEVWNQRSEAAINELFHPQGKVHGFPEPDSLLVGPEAFKVVYRQFIATFSNIHIALDDLIGEEDRVAVRWTCTMDHTGDAPGFAATGRKATLVGSSFVTFRDARLFEGWNFTDLTKMRLLLQRS
ncbi:MAG: hypothetical protein JWQ42_496 [Edaphobacter sp.]|jgi:predicted ester cyclase|nr:hypothetical protein [Edaphobacter sp.]